MSSANAETKLRLSISFVIFPRDLLREQRALVYYILGFHPQEE